MALCVKGICAITLRKFSSIRSYGNYVRKTRLSKKFLEQVDSVQNFDASAKYVITLAGRPLLTGALETCKLHLRMLYLSEIQEKIGPHQVEASKRNAILLDVFDGSEQQFTPIYGISLQPSTFLNNNDLGKNYENLENEFGGQFIPARLALMMLQSDAERNIISTMLAVNKWLETYKYCPCCTTPLVISLTKLNASCAKCSRSYYPTISPVAICLLTNQANTHALLVRHSRNPKSVYTCIAGFAQVGETLIETVHREVAEEVGIECRNVIQMNMSQWWPFPSGSLMFAYRAVAEQSHKLTISQEELENADWFSRDDIRAAYENTVSDPAMRKYAKDTTTKHQFYYIPPFGAIAHRMIKQWLDENT